MHHGFTPAAALMLALSGACSRTLPERTGEDATVRAQAGSSADPAAPNLPPSASAGSSAGSPPVATRPQSGNAGSAGAFDAGLDAGPASMDGSARVRRDAGEPPDSRAADAGSSDAGAEDDRDAGDVVFETMCEEDAGGSVARIRLGETELRGSLPAEYIRRTVRRQLADLRVCYDQLLESGACPPPADVSVKFIIAPSGGVQSAAVSSSTLGDVAAEQCIVGAVRAWSFAEPEGGGIVIVNQTFRFALTEG